MSISRLIGLIFIYGVETGDMIHYKCLTPPPRATCSYSDVFSNLTDHVVEEPAAK